MTEEGTTRTTRAQRLAMPLAREVVQDLAVEHGACIRPVQLRRTNLDSGEVEQVLVPCGHTLASVCPSSRNGRGRCGRRNAGKAGTSSTNPSPTPTPPPTTSAGGSRPVPKPSSSATRPPAMGRTRTTWTSSSPNWTMKSPAWVRGNVLPARPTRRHRSTQRRQDAPELPRRKVTRTVGKTYTAPDGKTFRPSMFVTLTCPATAGFATTYPGRPRLLRLRPGGRDALHFAALFDRFIAEPAPVPRL